MIQRIYNYAYALWVKYNTHKGLNRLWYKYSDNVKLIPLTLVQKKQIQVYWKSLIGRKVNTRWHQLLYSQTGVFTVRYLPFEIYHDIISNLSPFRTKKILDDKNLYRYILKDFNIPQRVLECSNGVYYLPESRGGEVPYDDVLTYCKNLTDCIIKPSKDSSAGNGVESLSVKDGSVVGTNLDLSSYLKKYGRNFLIERKIKECDNLQKLNTSSCNTLRVHTFRNRADEKIVCLSAYMRIGRSGSVIDNAGSGGITVAIDKNGTMTDNACTVSPYEVYQETDTGIQLAGYKINNFDEIISTAIDAHSCLPSFGIIGWDIAIDKDDNVVIVEFNPDPDLRIEQLIFKDSCLLDGQEEVLREAYRVTQK